MSFNAVTRASNYISNMEYDRWDLFHLIPKNIKEEVIIQMDECMGMVYTFVWEGSWYCKRLRSDLY